MAYYEYIFNSINKVVGIPVDEKFYTSTEVKDLLNSTFVMLDHTLFEEYNIERKNK